jgi:hypothetical protein
MNRIGIAPLVTALSVVACAPGEQGSQDRVPPESTGVVEVTALGTTFVAPDSIPSGWTTFRFTNGSEMTHFALVERMPEGQGIASQQREVAPVFQDGMDLLSAGDVDGAMARFGDLPEWFGGIVFLGGPGLTGPGQTSEATVHLEPGTYLLECYVKTAGIFHSFNPDPTSYGMVHELTVTDQVSGATEPTADLRLSISSQGGIEMEGVPTVGSQMVAVDYVDQTVHENFVGHDVHLVRLEEGVDVNALEEWMDWSQPAGLQTPAPAVFLGGLNELPAGETGYFRATLEPGRYAWIAEVPGSSSKGMFQPFDVSTGGG